MNQQKTLESRVLSILKDCPRARFDDMILIMHYYNRYATYVKVTGWVTTLLKKVRILRRWQRKSKRCLSAIISISIRIPRKMFKCFEKDF